MQSNDDWTTRLGDPAELADRAAEEYRRTRWSVRRTAVVFGLLPLPATATAFAATLLLLWTAAFGIGRMTGGDENVPRKLVIAFAYASAWGAAFVPFAATAVVFTRLYLRSRVGPGWFVAAAVQILVVAGSLVSSIRYSDVPGQSAWLLGFVWAPIPTNDGWILPFADAMSWMQATQVLVPIAIGAILLRTARHREAVLAQRD